MPMSARDVELLRSQIEAASKDGAAGERAAVLARLLDELSATAEALRAAEEQLQRQAEELAASRVTVEAERERYLDLFDFAPDAYLLTDADGTILEANRAAEALLGIPSSRLVGKPLAAYVASPDRFTFRAQLEELAASEAGTEWEFRIARRRGDAVEVAATVAAAHDGARPFALRWLLRDTSARKQAEAEIRKRAAALERRAEKRARELSVERDRLRLLFERLGQGVITFDRRLRVGFANFEVRRLLGTHRLSPGHELPELWSETSIRSVARKLFTRKAQPVELIVHEGDRALLVLGLPAAGVGEGILVITDVTERERRDAAERAFVTNAAHELQTPLTAITTAIEVLQDGAKEEPEQRDLFLGHVEREAARLRRLVRALLMLARAQTGVEPPRREPIRVRPLLEEVGHGLQPVPGVTVEIDCSPRLAVLANRELTEQAVANIGGNAAKYTSSGRIRLGARKLDDGRVAIEVQDTGRGISPSDRERIFERFYRGDLAGVHDWSGFGLGLPIAAETVKTLGGELEIDSEPGRGTTARIILPAARKGA